MEKFWSEQKEPSVPTELSSFSTTSPLRVMIVISAIVETMKLLSFISILFVQYSIMCYVCAVEPSRKNSFPHLEVESRAMCENDGHGMGPADGRSAAALRYDHHELNLIFERVESLSLRRSIKTLLRDAICHKKCRFSTFFCAEHKNYSYHDLQFNTSTIKREFRCAEQKTRSLSKSHLSERYFHMIYIL